MPNKYWPLIQELGHELGAKSAAMAQWKTRRKVPHKYRLAMLERARIKGRALPQKAFEA